MFVSMHIFCMYVHPVLLKQMYSFNISKQ